MTAKLSVIFYILLCLEVGLVLTILPWYPVFGLGDWGDNFFLLYAAQKTGFQGLQHAMSSGWVRGAVTGLGVINLGVAVWEIIHFRQTVNAIENIPAKPVEVRKEASRSETADPLSDNERQDQLQQPPLD